MLRRDQKYIASHYAASAAAFISLAALLVAGCDRKTPAVVASAQTETPAAPEEPTTPALPMPPPALTRGDLVSAAGQAASAYAEGKAPTTGDPLVGRSFGVRVPFGCQGPSPVQAGKPDADGLAAWDWGKERKTLQLRMTPGNWFESGMLAQAGASEKWEAVEGFWIPRPWLASETCPAVPTDPSATDAAFASPQTVGLAAVFEAGGSRLARRNARAYEYTVRSKDDAPLSPPANGFRMLLEGRIVSFPSGRAIECRAPGPDQRPVCIVAVQLDRVAYEDADGRMLSEWRPG